RLVEPLEAREEVEDAARLRLVDPGEREADVDEHVVAGARLRDVLEADALPDPPELDVAHEHVAVVGDLEHAARNAEAHGSAPPRDERVEADHDGELAERESSVVRRDLPVSVSAESARLESLGDLRREDRVHEDAAAQHDGVDTAPRTDALAGGDGHRDERRVEAP